MIFLLAKYGLFFLEENGHFNFFHPNFYKNYSSLVNMLYLFVKDTRPAANTQAFDSSCMGTNYLYNKKYILI